MVGSGRYPRSGGTRFGRYPVRGPSREVPSSLGTRPGGGLPVPVLMRTPRPCSCRHLVTEGELLLFDTNPSGRHGQRHSTKDEASNAVANREQVLGLGPPSGSNLVEALRVATFSLELASSPGCSRKPHGRPRCPVWLDDESIALLRERQAFIKMNLVTYWALQEEGRNTLSQRTVAESRLFATADMRPGAEPMLAVNPAYGSDLLGGMHRYQPRSFPSGHRPSQPST